MILNANAANGSSSLAGRVSSSLVSGLIPAIAGISSGDGRYSSVQEACNDLVKDVDEYYPNLELHQKYELKFNLYKDIYNLQVKLRK